jgi:hypothetical protein
MPDQQPINLDEVKDLNELQGYYVQANEDLLQAQSDTQRHSQNLQAIRARMGQLQQDSDKQPVAVDPVAGNPTED